MNSTDRSSAATSIDTGYIRGVLDSTGRLLGREPGYVTDYWRRVIEALLDRVEELEAKERD